MCYIFQLYFWRAGDADDKNQIFQRQVMPISGQDISSTKLESYKDH